jgi:membrane-bound lytic murein transglycosylase F
LKRFGGKRLSRGLKTALACAVLLPFLLSGHDHRTQLERVLERGSLTMLTRNGASTYYLGPDGPTGPEVDMVRAFCDYLGVDLHIRAAAAFSGLAGMLNSGQGDLIAANLTRTPERELQFNFGPDYQKSTIEVVYRRGQKRPRSMEDLVGLNVMVIAGSSYEDALREARAKVPDLKWEARDDVGMEELLLAVSDGAVDATLVDSTIYSLNGQFYPRVAKAFELPGALPQAWAFPGGSDDTLVQRARTFFRQYRESGELAALHDAYFGHSERIDRVGMFQFLRQVRKRLPPLIPVFQEAAAAHDLDWRLLAAVGYQESHWDPEASSYTGVRGIMMLTQRTANQMGLSDRLDPKQSIDGGARYLMRLHGRIPNRIPEPDRTWLALAAYNMGMGHLEDARVLTEEQGGDPDSWDDVSQRLGLLSQEKYYSQTRYGYARGFEAQHFVENIKSYYDTLVWMDTREHPLLTSEL